MTERGTGMRALIVPNLEKRNAPECTRAVVQKLLEVGIRPMMQESYRLLLHLPEAEYCLNSREAFRKADFLIAIGGDGTMLHEAKRAVEWDLPLLGINLGRLGFMAEIEADELDLLARLTNGEYTLEDRMMLECTLRQEDSEKRYLALNDVVLSNGALSRMVDLDILCGGQMMMSYRANGVIVSTPTGSTAYALSAGGPIIEPSIRCIGLTPICPHSLSTRPVIISDERVLTLTLSPLSRCEVFLTVDGEVGEPICLNDKVEICRSEKSARFICLKEKSFYMTIHQKFDTPSGGRL